MAEEKVQEKIQAKEEQTGEPAVQTLVNTVIRNLVVTLGGGLLGSGLISEENLQTLAGGAVVVAGIVWSWWQKRKAAKRTQMAAK